MKELNITINFDLDGTLANTYGVEGWLEMLRTEDETPYAIAEPLLRLCSLAKVLNKLQREGYKHAIISWLSKGGSDEYGERVRQTKLDWLERHLPSVEWDEINIVPYGTPKELFCDSMLDILFDDEEQNRENWNGISYDVEDILGVLKDF